MTIEIKIIEHPDHYFVQVGPDKHVCSAKHRFEFQTQCPIETTRREAWFRATSFADGAFAALETASGLTERFISPSHFDVPE